MIIIKSWLKYDFFLLKIVKKIWCFDINDVVLIICDNENDFKFDLINWEKNYLSNFMHSVWNNDRL